MERESPEPDFYILLWFRVMVISWMMHHKRDRIEIYSISLEWSGQGYIHVNSKTTFLAIVQPSGDTMPLC